MNIHEKKQTIYSLILKGSLDETVLFELQNNGEFIPVECELWDYKEEFEQRDEDYAKVVKLILSMFNTYGGYIVYGVKEVIKDTQFSAVGIEKGKFSIQKLKGALDKYLGRQIDVNYVELPAHSKWFGIIQIPKRVIGLPSLPTIREAKFSNNKQVFDKNCTFYRNVDRCVTASTETDFVFLMGDREPFPQSTNKKRIIHLISHNLPDKSFICNEFIGRESIIQSLWAWLSDEFEYAKVLVGEGGRGKTSIAYQFSRLLITSHAKPFEQVIWLTAKTKQFRPELDGYVSTPETHFSDVKSLLIEICEHTGYSGSDLADVSEQQLKRIAKDQLNIIPSFLIVDDVDSADPDEQRKILETAKVIIGTGGSRVLLTTRANVSYSSETSIPVPGLQGEDFSNYLESICERYKIANFNAKKVKTLEVVSEGSPLFTESVVRLIYNGLSFDKAVDSWKGHKGEAVRIAALRREIEQLSIVSRNILFALCVMGESSLTELHSITELEELEVHDAINELGNLFLVQSNRIIEEEPRFITSESLKTLIMEHPNEYLNKGSEYLLTIAKRLKSRERNKSSKRHVEVGKAINQALAMVYSDDFVKARKTVETLLKKPQFHENPDLLLMRAKIDFNDPEISRPQVIAKIDDAYRKGQRKETLFDIWYELEIENVSARIEISSRALESLGNESKWLNRFSDANVDKSERALTLEKRIEYMAEAHEALYKILKGTRSTKERSHYQEKSKEITDSMYEHCRKERNFELGLRCAMGAIHKGDVRRENFTNSMFCLKALSKTVSNLTIPESKRRKTYLVLEESLMEFEIAVETKLKDRSWLQEQFAPEITAINEESIYPYQFEFGKHKK